MKVRKVTRHRLNCGVFRSVVEVQIAINHFVAETNDDPKPFVWRAHPSVTIGATP